MANLSTMYQTLTSTAQDFVHACRPAEAGTNKLQSDLLASFCSPDFTINWGHSFFISQSPPLQKAKTVDEWQAHMKAMTEKLETWSIDITDVIVDVEKKKAVVRGNFNMTVKGCEAVCNDILLVMEMSRDWGKVVKCTEFIDPIAGQEIGKNMAKVGA